MNLRFDVGRRLMLFLIISFGFLFIAGAVMTIIGTGDVRHMRVATLTQDILAFILPAVVTAVVVSGMPATFLGIDKSFSWQQLLLSVGVMIASLPVMNVIIDWNANIVLPDWASGFEEYMRQAESRAQQSVEMMLSGSGLGVTIVSILIVGVMAGFSEEIYFRGCLQRIIGSGRLSIHAAVLITAIIFSVAHFQFYGFVPRLLLGIFFGYLFVWSGSLWLPVTMHILNNSIYVLTYRHTDGQLNSFGTDDIWLVIASLIVTTMLIIWLIRLKVHVKEY